jgi:hypothetical protein
MFIGVTANGILVASHVAAVYNRETPYVLIQMRGKCEMRIAVDKRNISKKYVIKKLVQSGI